MMNNNIPQGYKESPLGVIPQDWEVRRLGEVCDFMSGGTPSKDNATYWNGDIPWISASTMHEQNIFESDLNISEAGLKRGSRLAQKDSLLLLVRGSMLWKKIPICYCLRDVAFNQDVKAILPNDLTSSSRFLLYWFLSNENNLLHSVVGTGIGAGKLETSDLKLRQIGVPPLAEQERIAEVLGTWDVAIEKQSQLVKALERRKRALMQQLLTARKRLPNFSAPWQNVHLETIADLYQPQTISSSDLHSNGYSVFGANGFIGYYDKYNHEESQVVVTCRGSSCGTVNFTPSKCWITGNAMVFNVDNNPNVDKLYFYYAILSTSFDKYISGSGQPQIVRSPLLKLQIDYPPLEEQKAIAQILTTADKEIELATKKLETLRTQKRALMQQLLTGKKRLKI